jgi:hypothetical protein
LESLEDVITEQLLVNLGRTLFVLHEETVCLHYIVAAGYDAIRLEGYLVGSGGLVNVPEMIC